MRLLVTTFVRDEGTILVFEGINDQYDRPIQFAADRRPGLVLLDALRRFTHHLGGEQPEVEIEDWQVVG